MPPSRPRLHSSPPRPPGSQGGGDGSASAVVPASAAVHLVVASKTATCADVAAASIALLDVTRPNMPSGWLSLPSVRWEVLSERTPESDAIVCLLLLAPTEGAAGTGGQRSRALLQGSGALALIDAEAKGGRTLERVAGTTGCPAVCCFEMVDVLLAQIIELEARVASVGASADTPDASVSISAERATLAPPSPPPSPFFPISHDVAFAPPPASPPRTLASPVPHGPLPSTPPLLPLGQLELGEGSEEAAGGGMVLVVAILLALLLMMILCAGHMWKARGKAQRSRKATAVIRISDVIRRVSLPQPPPPKEERASLAGGQIELERVDSEMQGAYDTTGMASGMRKSQIMRD